MANAILLFQYLNFSIIALILVVLAIIFSYQFCAVFMAQRVNSTATFWNWTREKLVPGLFLSEWYNGQQVDLEEGFISSGYPFLVGMPRLRQIRVQTGKTRIHA